MRPLKTNNFELNFVSLVNFKNKIVFSAMQEKLNVDTIIASLRSLDNDERARLQSALFELQSDLDLKDAITENLDDIKTGRVSAHDAVMKEIREKYI